MGLRMLRPRRLGSLCSVSTTRVSHRTLPDAAACAMLTAMDVKAKFAEYEYTIKLLSEKLEELAATNERLQAGLDAHSTLQSIYRDESAPRSDRIKAAN